MIDLSEIVIIVDDDEVVLKTISSQLAKMGLSSKGFTSATAALSALAENKTFLIISDYKMPEMNGQELLLEVRKILPTTPFIFLTAHSDKELALASLRGGANEILEKPVSYNTLKTAVTTFAKRRIQDIEDEKKELEEIIQLFYEESTDLLSGTDQLLLKLEEVPVDMWIVDALFRKIHSVKGASGAIPNAKTLSSLAHEYESVLTKIKAGEFEPTAKAVSIFLESTDTCLKLLEYVRDSKEPSKEITDKVVQLVGQLKSLIETVAVPSATPVPLATAQVLSNSRTTKEDFNQEGEGIWVSNDKLDSFMALSGEIIVLKNQFQMMTRDLTMRTDIQVLEKKHAEFSHSLSKITEHLQEQIMSVRKVSLDRAFSKLGRIVRQSAIEVGKRVRLDTDGLELGVDKNIAKSLSSSLVHMVRNSIDHGIETPQDRTKSGKSPEGLISIHAHQSMGTIHIVITDDGRGVSRDRVIAKAVKSELVTMEKAVTLADEEVFEFIFLPGFSTAEKVTGMSGRGVGMDVVKSSVVQHGGRIKISSVEGKGVKFNIEIPIPKAVMVEQTVLAHWENAMFAVPLTAIARIVSCDGLTLTNVDGVRFCQFEGKSIVLRTLNELISGRNTEPEEILRKKSAVFLQHKHRRIGLVVDQIDDQLEAVVREFDSVVKEIPGFKGTTILGDEQIAYVVSTEKVLELFDSHFNSAARAA